MSGNYQRRIFRGRGGPTDKRLPQRDHRRPQKDDSKKESLPKYQSPPSNNHVHHPQNDISATVDEHLVEQSHEPPPETVVPPIDDPCETEVQHLRRRIQRNRRTMSLCQTCNQSNYHNTLRACRNTLREWQSIQRRYYSPLENHLDSSSPVITAVHNELFAMIQHSLQTGPLQNAQPAYFKRCGSEIASLVLDSYWSDDSIIIPGGFTPKQQGTLEGWKVAAQTAAQSGRPPSKSMLKRLNTKQS